MNLLKKVWENKNLVKVLKEGGVVVMPTDTIYGIVGKALSQPTVERIYDIKKRAPEKPCIILISDWAEVEKFGVDISKIKIPEYNEPTSFVLNYLNPEFEYLHRGTHTLAFRKPNILELQNLLKETGPLIAPSGLAHGAKYQRSPKLFR